MRLFLTALLAAAFAAGSALADDSALNKEGYWTVGRGDAEAEGCLASVNVGDTAMLIVTVTGGEAAIAVGTKAAMRKGKQGVLVLGDQRFAFVPTYGEGKRDLMFMGELADGAMAALSAARWVSVMVDGREILAADLDGSGAAGAVDAVTACAKGESGWWGPGVGAPASVAQADEDADPAFVYREPGDTWGVSTHPGYCIAQAQGPDARFVQLLAIAGRTGIAVGSKGAPLPRGAKAVVETDSYKFEFKTEYADDARYMNSADPLEHPDLFALQRAKRLRITTGGRELLDVSFDGDSFFQIIDAVGACARGAKGWWGDGAAPAR